MIRLALVEDDVRLARIEKQYIQKSWKLEEDLDIQVFEQGEMLLDQIDGGSNFDILIMDIELPGVNGIRLGQIMKERGMDPSVIFLTAHEGYALESYKMEARQYILKNEMRSRLPDVLNQTGKEICKKRKNFRLIQTDGELRRICLDDLLYFFKEGKYVTYILKNGVVRERTSLEMVIDEIGGFPFIKTERGYVVNARFVVRITEDRAHLINGEAIPVSRRLMASVKREIVQNRSRL